MFTFNAINPRLCLGALLLTGCAAVGPDYAGTPEVDLPKAWNHQIGAAATVQQDLSQWWQKLDDPQLTSLIERANSGSLDLRIALARIEEAEAQ